ncbi:sulfatase [Aporhodopirellula aestuarii]|uniref:Sulfatase n=1 Tax=Aporhodopirellula aestuarii TaxID=2950107 RepID=A0ABT0UDR4_9BACT|nr:sulfatase [Aporhodopirellula aestuarii]MCM2375060.1 sulfatase [Aporhodopirellula aestuarii]
MRIVALVFVAFFIAACSSANAKSPNIILILTDDQGWSQVSHLAHPDVSESKSDYLETPNMSRIVDEGMLFTRGYSPAPLCTPTRRSILCGASAARSGSEFSSTYVPAEHMTLPHALKQANANYVTAHFGKWGERMISTPEECGYDVSDGETGNATGGIEDKMKPFHVTEDPKLTGSVTDRAIDFIKQQAEAKRPFYAQISYYAVHLRVELKQASLDKYQAKGTPDRAYTEAFAGMLGELDAGVGRILDTLDELDLSSDTYVVFTSDNGGRGTIPGGNDKRLPTNHPLKGAKHSLDEGGLRVPFYVRGPGIKANSVSHEPVAGYDFLPTFYELAGGTTPLPDEVDGGSFVSVLRNPSETNAVKRGIDGLVFHRAGRRGSIFVQDEYKLFLTWNRNGSVANVSLYNTLTDHAEKHDIASSQPEKVSELQEQLLTFLKSVDAEKVSAGKKK